MKRFLTIASWGYLFLVVALWALLFLGGDRWWPATLLLFGPRWVLLMPLPLLVLWAGVCQRRLLVPLLVGGGIVAGPYMGLEIPWISSDATAGTVLRVITCNVQSGSFRKRTFGEYLYGMRADIVALQECPREIGFVIPAGWHLVQEGGLAILSRYPVLKPKTLYAMHPPHKWPRACMLSCVIKCPGGDVNFATVHLPSPRYGLQAVLDRRTLISFARTGVVVTETAHRRETAAKVSQHLAQVAGPLIVAGDFNMPADSTIYRKLWADGYVNAFSRVGLGYGWTVHGGPRKLKTGVRVDHVLVRNGLGVFLCETGPDMDSDHLPLIADIAVNGAR